MSARARVLVSGSLVVCCAPPNQPDSGDLEPTIMVTSGGIPTDTAKAHLPAPLRLEARDPAGRPVPNGELEVASVPTGNFDPLRTPHVLFAESAGRLPSATLRLVTGDDGSAMVFVSRGAAAGAGVARVTGRIAGRDALLDLPWTILPGAPAKLEFAPHDTAIFVGSSFQYRVDLRDAYNNKLTQSASFELGGAGITVTAGGSVAAVSHGRVRIRGHLGAAEAIRWVSVVPRFQLAALFDGIILTESDGHDQRRIANAASANPLDSWPGAPQLVVGKFSQLLVVPVSGQPIGSISVPGIAAGEFLWPRFDRTGEWIYVALRVNESNGSELWRVRSDGTQTERLTSLGIPSDSDVNPHPSPDGTRVVFSSDRA